MIFLSSTTVSRTESEPNLFLAVQLYSPRLPDRTELITELCFISPVRKSEERNFLSCLNFLCCLTD